MAVELSTKCAQCQEPVPEGRERFCSNRCLAQHKREQERLMYGHRHDFRCVECGHELHLGRHRK